HLSHDVTWTEDPYHDATWQFLQHSLPFVHDLLEAERVTGEARYGDRAIELARDWARTNPRSASPTTWAWNDHSTALPPIALTCLARAHRELLATRAEVPTMSWLMTTLRAHSDTLADPSFYVREGNHALNQSIGLLELALLGVHPERKALAVE